MVSHKNICFFTIISASINKHYTISVNWMYKLHKKPRTAYVHNVFSKPNDCILLYLDLRWWSKVMPHSNLQLLQYQFLNSKRKNEMMCNTRKHFEHTYNKEVLFALNVFASAEVRKGTLIAAERSINLETGQGRCMNAQRDCGSFPIYRLSQSLHWGQENAQGLPGMLLCLQNVRCVYWWVHECVHTCLYIWPVVNMYICIIW